MDPGASSVGLGDSGNIETTDADLDVILSHQGKENQSLGVTRGILLRLQEGSKGHTSELLLSHDKRDSPFVCPKTTETPGGSYAIVRCILLWIGSSFESVCSHQNPYPSGKIKLS